VRDCAETQGGEALLKNDVMEMPLINERMELPEVNGGSPGTCWYVLWTQSHCEELVFDQLTAKGFELFLPRLEIWRMRAGRRHLAQVPMFPGYLFLRHDRDRERRIEVRKTRGLVRVLGGERYDQWAEVPDGEIEAVRSLMRAQVEVRAHPYLREGQRVRIVHGPLTDIEGILVRRQPNKGLLVLSVNLLQRSVSVRIDCTMVVPA
jgi:transcription antitermination factor NusG